MAGGANGGWPPAARSRSAEARGTGSRKGRPVSGLVSRGRPSGSRETLKRAQSARVVISFSNSAARWAVAASSISAHSGTSREARSTRIRLSFERAAMACKRSRPALGAFARDCSALVERLAELSVTWVVATAPQAQLIGGTDAGSQVCLRRGAAVGTASADLASAHQSHGLVR